MISVRGVTKRFGERVAVNDVSFTVKTGEIMGFLGPNGAGKTTTMRIITGYMPPTEGSVSVNDMDVFEHPYEVKTIIGYMPEHPPLYLEMTVKEYLRFAAELRGLRGQRIKEAIDRVVELCGISHVFNRLVGNLSKGYRQRVGLAQALVHDPEVLVLDEPTVGLDPRQIVEIRQLIKDLGRDKTVILSTHILQEVTTICESVTIINHGSVVASDRIDALSRRFADRVMIHVRVKRPEKIKIERLQGIEGVGSVEMGGGGSLKVHASGDIDIRERVAEEIVSMSAGLLEIRSETPGLEDIFIKVVTEDVSTVA